jgi:hypothetical protein
VTPIAVTTRSYDNARTGANSAEPTLTADSVSTRGIRRLSTLHVPGDARGVEAQPLVVPNVELADGTTREVIYLASMANDILAFDAADGGLLWSTHLGTPVKGSKAIDAWLVNDHWGILSTPVIDVATNTLYAVSWTSADATVAHARHVLHAVDLRDGKVQGGPLDLEGASFDPGHGLPEQRFRSAPRKQRASLLLTTITGVTTVFIAFGSVKETDDSSRGWIIACATSPLSIAGAWTATSRGHGGGIWQGGAGIAADDHGFIYAMTGNGTFDAVTDFGESFVKLRYAPPTSEVGGSLQVVDWWTPFTDDGRVGLDRGGSAEGHPDPTNRRRYTESVDAGWDDMDLGSGGPVIAGSHGLVMGAGKDGVLYVLDHKKMGKTRPADLEQPSVNYAKLKSPPIFYTYYPGTGLDPAPTDISTLNTLWAGRTHHLHGGSIYWESPDLGSLLYNWGENGNLRVWRVDGSGQITYLACGAEAASVRAAVPPGGMPGGMLTLSADAARPGSAVVWALIPYLDANRTVSQGRLLAYDATRFGTYADGSKQLRVLWDSETWNHRFSFNKFNVPVVANGRLLVPTYDGSVIVYGT